MSQQHRNRHRRSRYRSMEELTEMFYEAAESSHDELAAVKVKPEFKRHIILAAALNEIYECGRRGAT